MSQTTSVDNAARLRAFLSADGGGEQEAPAAMAAAPIAPRKETATPSRDLDNVDDIDSEAGFDDGPIHISASDLGDFWSEGWHPIEIVAGKRTVSKSSGNPQIEASYRGIAGPMTGCYKTDYWPLTGKGVKKTGRIAQAIGLRCPQTGDLKIPSMDVLAGKRMWILIQHKLDQYEPEPGKVIENLKDEIVFPHGYEQIDKFEMPKAGDVFAESGAPIPAAG